MISTHELSEKVGQAQRFTRMEIFLQQMVNGLVIASVLVLVALGITLIFGLTGIVFFRARRTLDARRIYSLVHG